MDLLVTCWNCNGLGEKTRKRGSHSSIHRTTKCHTCLGSGKIELTPERFETEIVEHIKPKITKESTAFQKIDEIALLIENWGTQKGLQTAIKRRDYCGENIFTEISHQNNSFQFKLNLEKII